MGEIGVPGEAGRAGLLTFALDHMTGWASYVWQLWAGGGADRRRCHCWTRRGRGTSWRGLMQAYAQATVNFSACASCERRAAVRLGAVAER